MNDPRDVLSTSWTGRRAGRALAIGLVAWSLAVSAGSQAAEGPEALTFERRASPGGALAPPPFLPGLPPVDDGTFEGVVGFGLTTARSFLWFNRFTTPTAPFALEEIQVLFPSGESGLVLGDAVQLAVYHDADGDPANGADLLATFDGAIQALDGVTFSVYSLEPPIWLVSEAGRGDLLIGVVNRFAEGSMRPAMDAQPAALDTSSQEGRSWVALWQGDPPDQPTLPADQFTGPLAGSFVDGNWMIRGVGRFLPPVEVPTLGDWGLVLLVGLLAVGGLARLRSGPGSL